MKPKMLILYVGVLALMPLFFYLAGCKIGNLVCDVKCDDDCNLVFDIYWEPCVCELLCEVKVAVTNLPDNCRVSSGLYLTTDDGSVYIDDRDPINGNLVPVNHNGSAVRDVTLKKCYGIDPNDPQGSLDNFMDSVDDVSYMVQVCKTNACDTPPLPGWDKALLISLPSLTLPWTFVPDPGNCSITMNYDASQLTEVTNCIDCCN